MFINKVLLSYAKKWWNSTAVGSMCEVAGIRAGNSYYIEKYLPYHYTVHDGIFKGMKYLDTATGSSLNPKLVGTYERELYPWIQRLKSTYKHIINLGSAEGYYAVGLALRFPQSQIHAYDSDSNARALCQKLASINQVTNISIHSLFDTQSIKRYKGDSLIVCDIEGAEVDLLDPKKQATLLEYDYIVECHDHLLSVSDILIQRFRKTHNYTTISPTKKRKKPALFSHMPDSVFALLSDEGRFSQKPVWLQLMRKK